MGSGLSDTQVLAVSDYLPWQEIFDFLPARSENEAFRGRMADILYGDTKIPSSVFSDRKLLDLLSSKDSTAEALLERIKLDPALNLKIMRLSRMSIYQRGGEIGSLEDAYYRLGLSEIRNLIYAEQVARGFRNFDVSVDWRQFWFRSILQARLTERVTTIAMGGKNFGFVNGLLNNTGSLIFKEYFVENSEEVLKRVASGMSQPEAEMSVFGFNHAHLSGILCMKWHFPLESSLGAYYHHSPRLVEEDDVSRVYAVCGLVVDRLISTYLELGDHLEYSSNEERENSYEWGMLKEYVRDIREVERINLEKESEFAFSLAGDLVGG